MNFKEYQGIVDKTAIFPKEVGLAYCVLGLVDELGEFIEKLQDKTIKKEEIQKEAGDVFWYIAALSRELNVDLEELVSLGIVPNVFHLESELGEDIPTKLFIMGAEIQGKIKKIYRDGNERKKVTSVFSLANFFMLYIEYLEHLKYDVKETMQINYDKLTKRLEEDTLKGDGDNR